MIVNPAALSILKILAKGLFGRLLGYAAFGLGFWLLFLSFSRSNPLLGVLGAIAVLVAMYLMVLAKKANPATQRDAHVDKEAEESGDSIDGSDQGS
jgi:hypothetical protein